MSDESEFAYRVADYLHEISLGELSITDAHIEQEKDPSQAAMLMGLLMLHEDLKFQQEQRRVADERLSQREARFRALFDLAKVSIWDCGFGSAKAMLQTLSLDELATASEALVQRLIERIEVNAVNHETLRLLGADDESDLKLTDIFGGEAIPMMRSVWQALRRGETRVELEGVVHRLNGEVLQVMLGVTLPPGDTDMAILSLSDISVHAARVEAEQQAEERAAELATINVEVERLFYAVSHDMRAPLRAVMNLASWAQEDSDAGNHDEVTKHLRMIEQRIGRLDRMMNDLLSYARIGRTVHDVEPVNVGDLLAEINTLANIPDGFTVTWGDMPTLRTQRTLISQVFLNLIGNAIKHHDKPEGRITITAEHHEEQTVFRVSDDGPGIPKKYHAKVFGLFNTLSPRDVVEGSGMGLALVQKVVRKVGGAITIEGDDERGTSFKFAWPNDREDREVSNTEVPAAGQLADAAKR